MLSLSPRYNWNIIDSGIKYHTRNIHEFLVNENLAYILA